jgi:hypothetical protein
MDAVASEDLMRGSFGMPLANEPQDQLEHGHGVAGSMHTAQDVDCLAQPCLHGRHYALHVYLVLRKVKRL